ncbi:MAG: polysaccharide deacetylase family protein [Candidatus Bathyarchaeum sp.]|nr:MAG: polysaccharide deacetylase family protein [Candidatus Bathyarchaeum sp.]
MKKLKKQQYFFIASVLIVISIIVALCNEVTMPKKTAKPPVIVVRIDDVQDFAFKDAQLYLMEYSRVNKLPVSLAIIPKFFGMDHELVEATIQAIRAGSEVVVHGWEHEDLAQFALDEQNLRLLEAKQYLEKTLNTETKVLVPPMFSYNSDTIIAMETTGYTIISGLSEFHEKGWASVRIQSIPATIELSDYGNETWQMKSRSVILKEVEASIEKYGYAMIVTHPQEFMEYNSLNRDVANEYEQILQSILENFSFNTIEGISNILQ